MTNAGQQETRRTALYDEHLAAGGRMVEFAGWAMPISYEGIVPEHHAVRRRAGLFDVSHMGELELRGPQAEAFLNRVTTNDVSRLKPWRAHYSCFPNERGGVHDDTVIYRLEDHFLVVVNASNREKIVAHLTRELAAGGERAELRDVSLETSLVAVQGPRALDIVALLTRAPVREMRYYACAPGEVAGMAALISRTGYTGEDGFEIYLPWAQGPGLWRALLEAGKAHGIAPAGLGARDTLRLEARLALYGHELEEDISPLEADLDRWVKLDKPAFIGRARMLEERERGPRRALIGFTTGERVIPRAGMAVHAGGRRAGAVTSGTFSPTLGHGIALALVERPVPPAGSQVSVEVRGQLQPGTVVEGPFYRRPQPKETTT